MIFWLRMLSLSVRLACAHPELAAADRAAHVMAAAIAETPAVPAELLLALARTESSWDPRWVSRLEDGVRTIGIANRRVGTGPRFCGPLQTIAGMHWVTCLAQRNLVVGYVAGRHELEGWIRRGGSVRRGLGGYGCGARGMRTGCGTYVARVLRRAWRLGMAKPESIRKNQKVKDRRLALLRVLSPEMRCDRCGVQGLPAHLLEIDHVNGRPDYASAKLSSHARVVQYERELADGVKLRVLCTRCNKVTGGNNRYGRERGGAADRDRSVLS